MAYTISALAALAGLSARTLRYYDTIGLLKPQTLTEAGYRLYGESEVDRLQQILLYREMGLPLEAIKRLLDEPDFDRRQALENHLAYLQAEQKRLERVMDNVKRSLRAEEGKITMTDQEKFQGFKERLAEENEERYGQEIKERYGEETIAASRQKFTALSQEEYAAMEALAAQIRIALKEAVQKSCDPEGEAGQQIAALHKKWLSYTWPSYTPEAHAALAQMYTADERFRAYYDQEQAGCAQFLCTAIQKYTEQ